jgi:anthranilate synthase/indole-3-glycerol phosphate synthase/phosphoribosylanthranilate isomerase
MAVRHREYCVEAVQYHPESCMSEGGKGLMANFLKMKGAYWGEDNTWCGVKPAANGSTEKPTCAKPPQPSLPTILNQIHAQRLRDVEVSSSTLAATPVNLKTSLSLHAAPPQIDFPARLTSSEHTAIMAEIKRASPSKGDIAPLASAPAQALRYAIAGASVISVLTEPKWFKGSLTDMLAVRQALDSLPNRPAILRKDFILAPYQIDEARLYGADTVLLIVAMLEPKLLKELYDYSRSLGMEPLVEVNNPEELELALEIGSKVIGVNNRNLHDFNVDMSTTSRVNAALNGKEVVLCALSGISSREDVEKYVAEGVKAVLVGESLMRAENPSEFLRTLAGIPAPQRSSRAKPLVKICGIQSVEDAKIAIDAGADMLGVIMVPGTKRMISLDTATEIADLVRSTRSKAKWDPSSSTPTALSVSTSSQTSSLPWFTHHSSHLIKRRKPLLVGVFMNQPLDEILAAVDEVGLDIVQLHGDEPQQWARFIPVPVIKCFKVSSEGTLTGGQVDRPGLNSFNLLDAAGAGGEGKTFPWLHARDIVVKGEVGTEGRFPLPVILAGGLNPDNVAKAIGETGLGVFAVDVSSGVEVQGGGRKDADKVRAFVNNAKSA